MDVTAGIISKVVREARWVNAGDGWLDKIVEHTTETGRKNRVKVRSLPPAEREKYRPKPGGGGDEENDVRKRLLEKRLKLIERKPVDKEEYGKKLMAHVSTLKNVTFDSMVPKRVKKHADDLIGKGLTTGYNLDRAAPRGGINVVNRDYSEALASPDKKQVVYHMYKDHPEHGQELLSKLHDAGVQIDYEINTMASTVVWDDTWDEEPEMKYEKVGGKKVARSVQYAIMFRPKDDAEANMLADKLKELANRSEKNPHAKKAIDHSWFVPDIRSTGGQYDEYEENYVNYRKSGSMDLMFLSKKPQEADGFRASKLYLNKEISAFI